MTDQAAEPPIKAFIAPVTPLQQNCTVVWCTKTKKAAIIDPGGEAPRLLKAIADQGLTLEAVWLTHGHLDHAGGAVDVAEAAGVPIIGPHLADKFLLDSLVEQGARWGMGGTRNVTPDRWLQDGDAVRVGETEWEVYFTPGHTPGHVIFFHRPSRFAQVGDVLFNGSVGRTDLPGGDHRQLVESIVTKLWPLGDVRFVPGHGPMSTFARERATNPFVGDEALADMAEA